MSIDASGDVIILSGDCRVEEAEQLVAALATRERPVDIEQCRHMHSALVQALLSLRATVTGWPIDPFIREFVAPQLQSDGGALGPRRFQ